MKRTDRIASVVAAVFHSHRHKPYEPTALAGPIAVALAANDIAASPGLVDEIAEKVRQQMQFPVDHLDDALEGAATEAVADLRGSSVPCDEDGLRFVLAPRLRAAHIEITETNVSRAVLWMRVKLHDGAVPVGTAALPATPLPSSERFLRTYPGARRFHELTRQLYAEQTT